MEGHTVRVIPKYEIAVGLTRAMVAKGSVILFDTPSGIDLSYGPDGSVRMPPYLVATSVQSDAMRLYQIHQLIPDDVVTKIQELKAQPVIEGSGTHVLYVHMEEPGEPNTARFQIGKVVMK